jgi:hypothetical protein
MSTATNPLIGSLSTQVPGPLSPLLGWPNAAGTNPQSAPQFSPPPALGQPAANAPGGAGALSTPFQGGVASAGNPFAQGHPSGKSIQSNLNLENILTSQYKNALIPQFAQMLFGAGTGAANVFSQYANLGSPYYQQAQQSVFGQGVQQAQNANAQARERLQASGYGYTPSGVGAATAGGMAVGESANLAQNFLRQLFQNEQLQLMGAQGLSSIAALFNPAQLTGQQASGVGQLQPTAAQSFQTLMQGIGQLLSGGGALGLGVGGG